MQKKWDDWKRGKAYLSLPSPAKKNRRKVTARQKKTGKRKGSTRRRSSGWQDDAREHEKKVSNEARLTKIFAGQAHDTINTQAMGKRGP